MRDLVRARQFWSKPLPEKARSVSDSLKRLASEIAMPIRLPFGAWWLARRRDELGRTLLTRGFEDLERHFVQRFLREGMTVLDIGAHHGLYTLLASKCVGPSGKVIAFEPSVRERRTMRLHLMLNRCRNVSIEEFALGASDGEAEFYVIWEYATGCNSLRPPASDIMAETRTVRVPTARLDRWLSKSQIKKVDFVKMDVEGGELDVLRGARELLSRRPRPIFLIEVQDVRTEPWGYPAKEIINYLLVEKYKWFGIADGGRLGDLDVSSDKFEGNFVACPEEATSSLEGLR
jgi:FkbM family methyltransferase